MRVSESEGEAEGENGPRECARDALPQRVCPGREPVAHRYRGKLLRRRQAPVGKCRRSGTSSVPARSVCCCPATCPIATPAATSPGSLAAGGGVPQRGCRRRRSRHTPAADIRRRASALSFAGVSIYPPQARPSSFDTEPTPAPDLCALRGREPRPLPSVYLWWWTSSPATSVSRGARGAAGSVARIGKMIGALIGAQSTYNTLVQTPRTTRTIVIISIIIIIIIGETVVSRAVLHFSPLLLLPLAAVRRG